MEFAASKPNVDPADVLNTFVASKLFDEFAGQKNNIRDTAKWMATAYAALAAVLVAGAPFSGLGTLSGCRLAVAALAGAMSIISSRSGLRRPRRARDHELISVQTTVTNL